MTMNRQITTGFNASHEQLIELEALKDTKHDGKPIKAGEVVRVSKSEAKRLLTSAKDTFRVSIG